MGDWRTDPIQPGHEYTKANVKFAVSVLQSEPVKKLQAFAESNKETQGKFTIGDEKVSRPSLCTSHSILTLWYSRTTCLCELRYRLHRIHPAKALKLILVRIRRFKRRRGRAIPWKSWAGSGR